MGFKESLYSIGKNKCAVCNQGDVFKSNKFYHPLKFDKMYTHCSKCNNKYEREVGFFYGAMYVGYAISVAFSVAIFCTTYLLFPETPYWMYIVLIISGLIILAPVTYRGGRLVWMTLFTKYNSEIAEKVRGNESV